ncbi:dentin sialophosphoprotein [Impatiens glandulifera]|uniref:dentin sialophosphoprotein n=1 Tax=Impatiens glandulifera TaxID=253017 RepID=UPI001FB1641F|nr:dentin sialophosphoprotein [Impatiens glandulifera]
MGLGRGRGGQKRGRTIGAAVGLGRGRGRGRKNKEMDSDLSLEFTNFRSAEESTIQSEEKAGSGGGGGGGLGRVRVVQKRGRKKKEMDSDLSSESTKSRSGEESTIQSGEKDDASGGGDGDGGGFFACYLLTSLSPRHKGQTYIGFTVNPRRRIRQHNGEISSGAFRTRKKRPWEMVLCIYGFPTNVSALQFEWAWQHPTISLKAKEAAATMESISGLAHNIKLAYKMLNLPAWNSLNLTVNIFSSKYTIHSAGIHLPKHMKSQICSMDDLPCYTDGNVGGFLDDYNYDELNCEEDDLSDKHVREDDDGDGDKSQICSMYELPRYTDENGGGFFDHYNYDELNGEEDDLSDKHVREDADVDKSQICSMDELPCYADENGGGFFDDYNHDELNGEEDDLSDKHVREDADGDKDIPPSKTLSSSICGGKKVWLKNETFFELSDDDDDDDDTTRHENGGGLSDKIETHIGEDDDNDTTRHENGGSLSDKVETHIGEDDDGDTNISPLKTLSSSLCGGEKVWLTEETFIELSGDDDDNDTTRHENGGGLSDKIETQIGEDDDTTHIREDDDGVTNISPLKTLSSTLCGGEKVWLTEETFFELSGDDDDNDTTRHENGGGLSDKIETHIGEDDDNATRHENGDSLSEKTETHIGEDDDGDTNISPLKTLSSSLCGGEKVWLTNETFFELSGDDVDNDTTRHENGSSLSDKIETHIREDDDGDTNISPLKYLSSSLCNGDKVCSEETFFELSDDDDDKNCIIPVDKTHEVDVIDLLSPSPVLRCNKKKRRIMMDVIDLTESPVFV